MELCFYSMFCSKLGNEDSDAGRIKCSRGPHVDRGPQVPHPCISRTKDFSGIERGDEFSNMTN